MENYEICPIPITVGMDSLSKYIHNQVSVLREPAPNFFHHMFEFVIALCTATQAPVSSLLTRRSPDPTVTQLIRIHNCAKKLRLLVANLHKFQEFDNDHDNDDNETPDFYTNT